MRAPGGSPASVLGRVEFPRTIREKLDDLDRRLADGQITKDDLFEHSAKIIGEGATSGCAACKVLLCSIGPGARAKALGNYAITVQADQAFVGGKAIEGSLDPRTKDEVVQSFRAGYERQRPVPVVAPVYVLPSPRNGSVDQMGAKAAAQRLAKQE